MKRTAGRTVGIMACPRAGKPPIPEKHYFRELSVIGNQLGLTVFVFFPHRLDWVRRRVPGYAYNSAAGKWELRLFPLPEIVYDRCFYSNARTHEAYREPIRRLMASPDIRFLGHGLRGKWNVYQMLCQDEALHPYLPETELLRSMNDVARWLEDKGELFLKPQGGSHGKGVLRIAAASDGTYFVNGRTSSNEIVRRSFRGKGPLLYWVSRFTSGRKYIVQRYLNLTTAEGEPFDARALVQKNRKGNWELTGVAIRQGASGGITSNLHGGGRAEEAGPYLRRRYGADVAQEIEDVIRNVSLRIPEVLEQYHGRLVELGVDLGIDPDGRVWVLEVNSKPGRSSFAALSDRRVRIASVRNPILYARYMLGGDHQLLATF